MFGSVYKPVNFSLFTKILEVRVTEKRDHENHRVLPFGLKKKQPT